LILRCKQINKKQIIMQLHRYYYIAFLLFALITFQNNYGQTKAEEDEMLQLVNNLRSENGLPALRLNQNLNKAAFDHSKDMADNNYFDHDGLNGSTFGQRARNAGYTGFAYGENIAAGSSTTTAAFTQWKNSPDHLSNILNRNINEMGIGHATKVGSRFTHYWTQVFGKGSITLSTPTINLETNGFSVYPNPAHDLIYVDFDNKIQEPIKISIANITGQVVYQSDSNYTGNNLLTINIANLSNGVYLLKTQNGMSHKIVKQ
jgi:Cysteine-rich secretory protein family/Secretion system C-terminal sorting domain